MTKRNMTIILLFVERQICLQHKKIKIEIKYSLVNPCGKNKHRYPASTKKEKKKQRRPIAWQLSHIRLQEDKKLYPNDLYNKHG